MSTIPFACLLLQAIAFFCAGSVRFDEMMREAMGGSEADSDSNVFFDDGNEEKDGRVDGQTRPGANRCPAEASDWNSLLLWHSQDPDGTNGPRIRFFTIFEKRAGTVHLKGIFQ